MRKLSIAAGVDAEAFRWESMSQYAANTEVSSDRSRAEIERVLTRYGATQFMYGWDEDGAMVAFVASHRQVRFILPMPKRDDYGSTPTGRSRTAKAATDAWAQATRQRWRALALVIKAKLEAVESGIVTFDEEFLAHIVTPDGRRVGDAVLPVMQKAIAERQVDMPALLPGSDDR